MKFSIKALQIIVFFIIISSCQKDLNIKPIYLKEDKNINELFFQRKSKVVNRYIKTNSNSSSYLNNSTTFIDSVIMDLRIRDSVFKFSNKIINKFGTPLWDFSIQIKNDNLKSTLITPILDSLGNISEIIISHQSINNSFKYKIVNFSSEQKISDIGDKSATLFTKSSLSGIFKSFNIFIKNYLQLNDSNEIRANSEKSIKSNTTYVTFSCWYYVSYNSTTYTTTNTQCSLNVIITEDVFGGINASFDIPNIDYGSGGSSNSGTSNQYAPDDFYIEHYWENFEYDNNPYINPTENNPIYDNDGYRKNGPIYKYNGGIVQNYTNDKGDKFAIFTKADGTQIKFAGVTITDFGVLQNRGVTTSNGGIHASLSFNLAELQHEYGHYLQSNYYGSNYYNSYIVPASLWNMIFASSTHNSFWTEIQANQLSVNYFGVNSDIALDVIEFPR